MKKHLLLLLALVTMLSSCSTKQNHNLPDPEPILEADREFSKASVENGWVQAFLEFAEDSAVLLRPNAPPIEGKVFLLAYLAQYGDSTSQLSWEPKKGLMAASADLGYTYGIWTLRQGDTLTRQGTYVTIWRRNAAGQWKWMLDTGNSGLSDILR